MNLSNEQIQINILPKNSRLVSRREGLAKMSEIKIKSGSPSIKIEKSPPKMIRSSWSSQMLRVETSI